MSLAFWLLVYLAIAFAVGRLYEVWLGWPTVRLVFYPGMLVAAGGRLLACLAGQTKPGKVDVMRAGGPSTGGKRLPDGHVFRFLYAVGPYVTSLLAFVICWHALGEPLDVSETLPRMPSEVAAATGEGAAAAGAQLSGFLAELGEQRLGDWRLWVFLYVGFALIVAPAPSKSDLVSVGVFCAVLGLGVFGLAQAGVDVVLHRVYAGAFWEGLSFLLAMALFVLVVSFLLLLPTRLLRRSKD